MNFEEDNKFSDNCIDSKCLKKHIIKSKLFGENMFMTINQVLN